MRLLSLIPLPDFVADRFERAFDFIPFREGDPLQRIVASAPDALLCSAGAMKFDAALLGKLPPSVRAIATYSVGFDHLDLVACAAAGIAVFNTPEVLADSVADAALLLILGAARRATESVALIREGRWTGWTPSQLIGVELRGKQLGIMGMGEIGLRVARRARAFGMEISYSNRRQAPSEEGARFVADPRELLAQSDFFVLACPSTPQTRGFINRETLARAKRSLILINIGRGDLVEDTALIEALGSRAITAAGLDVFNGEPDFDRRYLELPNVFMLPHIGSSTLEARVAMAVTLVSALTNWKQGHEPPNRIA